MRHIKSGFGIILAIVAMTAMLCLIAGCSNTPSEETLMKDFVGSWELREMYTEENGKYNYETLSALKENGFGEVRLELKSDKTAHLDMFGHLSSGTWQITMADSQPAADILIAEYSGTAELDENGYLVMKRGDDKFIFQQSENHDGKTDEQSSSNDDSQQTDNADKQADTSQSTATTVPADTQETADNGQAEEPAPVEEQTADGEDIAETPAEETTQSE